MPTPKLSPERVQKVQRVIRENPKASLQQVSEIAQVSIGSVSNIKRMPCEQESKKVGEFHWREALPAIEQMQKLKKKASWSQEFADIELGSGEPIILATFCDTHIGAYGANYQLFAEMTDEMLNIPNLYIALIGDYLEMAIKLRGVLEVVSQVLTPEMQESFLESWLNDVRHKVAFATWDNHAVMRQESQAGTSNVKNMLARNVHYFNGIGHANLKVGKEVYKVAASHKFNGGSMFNRTHAQGRYARHEAPDREIVLQGDIHTWGISQLTEGGVDRVYITGGTLHENSGYAKRWFSLKSSPHYPCIVLMPDTHDMIPFKTISQAVKFIG